jgi:hypothetical protein
MSNEKHQPSKSQTEALEGQDTMELIFDPVRIPEIREGAEAQAPPWNASETEEIEADPVLLPKLKPGKDG